MAYAQIDYKDIQGIDGTYRISQIGCFLTSYSNLLQRLGVINIAPNKLNVKFIQKDAYIDVDDGVRDDLNFQLITKLYPEITVEKEGARSSNMPTHRNAIVRIKASNNFGTHFCLVDHIENDVVWIVDSYDGRVKKASVYGPIQGWAAYKVKKGNKMATEDQIRILLYSVLGLDGKGIGVKRLNALDRKDTKVQEIVDSYKDRSVETLLTQFWASGQAKTYRDKEIAQVYLKAEEYDKSLPPLKDQIKTLQGQLAEMPADAAEAEKKLQQIKEALDIN